MKDFNLRSFLTENRLTTLSKSLQEAKGTETLHIYNLPDTEDPVYLEVDVESYPASQDGPAEFDFEIIGGRWDNDGDNRLSDEEMAKYEDFFEDWVSDHYGLYSPKRTANRTNSNEEGMDVPTNEAPERESALIKVAREIWGTRDLAKKKALLNSFLDTSQIKSKDTIRATAEKIFSPARFDQYIANSILKFEKLGLDEEDYSQKKK